MVTLSMDVVVEKLLNNRISAAAIHGNKSQSARQRALEDFTKDRIQVLVATDIASRGIDIDEISHVINYELSHVVENYVHRIGRTARAGKAGSSIIFCDADEKSYLRAIERTTNQEIEIVVDHPYHSTMVMESKLVSLGRAKARVESKRNNTRQRRTAR